ncbi:MAG TPA: hypothetical protein VLT61_01170 [Anaeromyxobacteraceae bacterium]|nr:hypothetical protein [Anaeromyxobacteraceae bacterium]
MLLELALAERTAARRSRLGPPEPAPGPVAVPGPEASPVPSRLLGVALLLVLVLIG